LKEDDKKKKEEKREIQMEDEPAKGVIYIYILRADFCTKVFCAIFIYL